MTTKDPTPVVKADKPFAISGDQADIMHFLYNAIGDGFQGRMSFNQYEKSKKHLDQLWDELAAMRKKIGPKNV